MLTLALARAMLRLPTWAVLSGGFDRAAAARAESAAPPWPPMADPGFQLVAGVKHLGVQPDQDLFLSHLRSNPYRDPTYRIQFCSVESPISAKNKYYYDTIEIPSRGQLVSSERRFLCSRDPRFEPRVSQLSLASNHPAILGLPEVDSPKGAGSRDAA